MDKEDGFKYEPSYLQMVSNQFPVIKLYLS